MKINVVLFLGIVAFAVLGALIAVGCGSTPAPEQKPAPGPAEKAGAALDNAVKQSGEAVNKLADKASEATKDAANKAVQQTGQVLEKAGAAIEKSGANMQSEPIPTTGTATKP